MDGLLKVIIKICWWLLVSPRSGQTSESITVVCEFLKSVTELFLTSFPWPLRRQRLLKVSCLVCFGIFGFIEGGICSAIW